MNYSEAGKLGWLKSKAKHEARYLKVRREYNLNPNLCGYCSIELSFEKKGNKFCSHSCAAKTNNKGVTRHGKKSSKYCYWCGSKKEVLSSKYCSKECYDNYTSTTKFHKQFMSWITNGTSRKGMKQHIIWEQRGKCSRCCLYEWLDKPITLELEHIDGNSLNNSRNNLECLCPNCHSQTPTYKAKNIGKGRHIRRQRYRDGKSY